ncbi:alanine racemase [Salinimonas lutimaris]|uniref:alanine racemase n=1 Tax=Salinimonas lutimaris TaxID=914153 RepID=UPI0010C06E3C|nr:alanine racemase [Salinimonas lutimaris]
MSRQTQAIIHADAIIRNFKALRELAPDSKAMAVVKADAYGHGAASIARMLRDQADAFAVAIIEEAIKLREEGVDAPIIVLEGPHQPKDCLVAAEQALTLVLHHAQQFEWVADYTSDNPPALWLKVDTGMHRLGVHPDEVSGLLEQYQALIRPGMVLVTHMACADELDNPLTREQIQKIQQLAVSTGLPLSIANSPATIAWQDAHSAWNRLGLAMYGCNPVDRDTGLALSPAMTLRASVIALRDIPAGQSVGYGQVWTASRPSRIATIGIGYADGYPRHCPSGTPVLVNQQRAPLAGRVSMDMLSVDVTDLPEVKIGDKVELWGQNLAVDEIARYAGTVSYELVTRVSLRVPRVVKYL